MSNSSGLRASGPTSLRIEVPPTADELDLALLGDVSGLADDTDWERLYRSRS
ncbi:MAG TPA: hypothetical protein VG346_13930 [Acidimicrobiales bacterium]|nr:hypothetical protein [Acidimicrobiales bacterium]